MKRLFIDAEFTGLHMGTKLISLGIIGEKGEMFYAEFNDFEDAYMELDEKDSKFLDENVIPNLKFIESDLGLLNGGKRTMYGFRSYSHDIQGTITECCGDKEYVRKKLIEWLGKKFGDEQLLVVADVGHYDFCLFVDLICGYATELYKYHISACYHDINDDIANHFNVNSEEAFNMNRESMVNDLFRSGKDPLKLEVHNSLSDAIMTREIYKNIILD